MVVNFILTVFSVNQFSNCSFELFTHLSCYIRTKHLIVFAMHFIRIKSLILGQTRIILQILFSRSFNQIFIPKDSTRYKDNGNKDSL